MDRYLEVTTLREANKADRSCEVLENAGIPVLIRHVEITEGDLITPGFTLLVPWQHSNQAHSLMEARSEQLMAKSTSSRISLG